MWWRVLRYICIYIYVKTFSREFLKLLTIFSQLLENFFQFIYKSVPTTSQIGFDIALTNVEATLKQRWVNVDATLWKVENPTSDFIQFSTSHQRYFNVDAQLWNNVDQMFKCWLEVIRLNFCLGNSILNCSERSSKPGL